MNADEQLQYESTIDDIFRVAIKREAAAKFFYIEAANRVHSTAARELLLRLARDESEHERLLSEEYNHIIADRDVTRAMGMDV